MEIRNSNGIPVYIRTEYSKFLECGMIVLYEHGRQIDKYILRDFTEKEASDAREIIIKRNNLIREGNIEDLTNLFSVLAEDNKPIPYGLYSYLETLKDEEIKNLHKKLTLLSMFMNTLVSRTQ